jgi:RNA polymerase sigma-70 factor (ECF subfamily)
MDDDELIARLAGGDDAALRDLFNRHAPWLAARLHTVLPPSDVEDVLQETFLAVWKGAKNYTPQDAAGGWLWGIARRQAALLLRRRGPGTVALPDEASGLAGAGRLAGAGAGAGVGDDPAEAVLARADLEAATTAALGPPRSAERPEGPEREVWRLMYLEDRPIAEVAELTGVPEGTVKSRAHRARRLLRAALGGAR